MTAAPRWSDLRTRILTGGALAIGGGAAMMLGGTVFLLITSLVAGILVWELTRMVAPEVNNRAVIFSLLSALAVAMAGEFETGWAICLAVLPAVLGLLTLGPRRWRFFAFALLIQGAAYELTVFRADYGVKWLIWLLLVVVATDIAGYFAGRRLGGPKFWPRVSPNKTWSGTIAGWVASGAVGAAFLTFTAAGPFVILLSMLLSFAAQMGDIAESALKRSVGVKDSSDLLPGHGGLFDRFDGVLGASVFMLAVAQLTEGPGLV
ncbi:MAG: phosphatidate cytidylyltransferase [Paracoccaceae bacterium]|nr:phosphatidate cytidylyltransferase [Paracoccaceae bacterium]